MQVYSFAFTATKPEYESRRGHFHMLQSLSGRVPSLTCIKANFQPSRTNYIAQGDVDGRQHQEDMPGMLSL